MLWGCGLGLGSQISRISVVKDALREAGRFYVELAKLGANMKYFDVGGGLGIDYDGSKTSFQASMNYTLSRCWVALCWSLARTWLMHVMFDVVCYDVVCCGVLCCAVLCCGVLCCAVLWCGVVNRSPVRHRHRRVRDGHHPLHAVAVRPLQPAGAVYCE